MIMNVQICGIFIFHLICFVYSWDSLGVHQHPPENNQHWKTHVFEVPTLKQAELAFEETEKLITAGAESTREGAQEIADYLAEKIRIQLNLMSNILKSNCSIHADPQRIHRMKEKSELQISECVSFSSDHGHILSDSMKKGGSELKRAGQLALIDVSYCSKRKDYMKPVCYLEVFTNKFEMFKDLLKNNVADHVKAYFNFVDMRRRDKDCFLETIKQFSI